MRIKKGPHKGLIGIVRDVTPTAVRVEIHTSCKTLTIPVADIKVGRRGLAVFFLRASLLLTPPSSLLGNLGHASRVPGHAGQQPVGLRPAAPGRPLRRGDAGLRRSGTVALAVPGRSGVGKDPVLSAIFSFSTSPPPTLDPVGPVFGRADAGAGQPHPRLHWRHAARRPRRRYVLAL